MRSSDGRCLSESDIERLAQGRQLDGAGLLHVERCGACRERLESAREDAAFLQRARDLAGPVLGPEGAPRIPGYRTLGEISSGSQGTVYQAVQESTSRTVAIKVLSAGRTGSARQRARAEREAEIAARLRHPNIVTVFESRTLADGRVAVVMEFVDGVPIDRWQPVGATPAEREAALLHAFIALCAGVHHAHLNGVIHRDLKPDNVLVSAEGRPVVLDFGIAKAGGLRTTLTGEFAGTPAYASPEQASGRGDNVDALTDIYSLGVILYRLLCGAMPYEVSGSIFEIARAIGESAPAPPRTRVPSLSPDLEAIVLRALEKEKERRYQSAAGLARDLERYLAGSPVDARSGSGWYLLTKAIAINRGRLVWVAGALAAVSVAAVIAGISLLSAMSSARRAAEQHEQAQRESIRASAVTELLRAALPNADPARPEVTRISTDGFGRLYFRLETGAFADEPELDQTLRRLWGGVYTGLGGAKAASLVEYAEVSLRNGLTRLRLEHGQEHPEIAATLHELAAVLMVRLRGPEAETTCRQAIAMREKLLGPRAVQTIESRALLARILFAQGRLNEAEGEAQAALSALGERSEQSADLLVASMVAVRARARMAAGDLAGCEPLLRDALVRRLRRLPPEDPDLVSSLRDLADLVERAPASSLAVEACGAWGVRTESCASELRQDAKRIGTPDRGGVFTYVKTGRADSLGRLLRLQEVLLGPNDPALVPVLLARMRAAVREADLASRAESALRAAELLASRFGPNDSSVVTCLDEAAPPLIGIGRPEEAAAVASRALKIRLSVPEGARDALLTANARRRLAWYLALSERFPEAVEEYRRATDELQAVVGPEHHVVALAQAGLAFCLCETGDLKQADSLSERALAVGERMPAIAWDQISEIRFARGHILLRLNRFQESRAILERIWDPQFRCAGVGFRWRQVLIEDVATACDRMGDRALAQAWRDRTNESCEEPTSAR